ncbi:MAG: hypothetical protein ACOCXP_02855 [Candidatus Dojkabacteria bacterium]
MLTARQTKLLEIIINEFMETAEAVGSVNVSDKYDLEVSPATIRNEMAYLTELGLLEKSHISAGRKPTAQALRWFLQQVLEDLEELDALNQVSVRESLFKVRFNVDTLLTESVRSLADLTNNAAIAMLSGRRYMAGVSQMVGLPEYSDEEKLRRFLDLIEDYRELGKLFGRYDASNSVRVLIGEETGFKQLEDTAIAYAAIKLHGNEKGYMAVIGPNRMDYRRVIPAINYIVGSIQNAVAGW